MKKLVLLFVLLVGMFATRAANATFRVASLHHERFVVYVNGVQQNFTPTESIGISGIILDSRVRYDIKIVVSYPEIAVYVMRNVNLRPGNNHYFVSYSAFTKKMSVKRTSRTIIPSHTVGIAPYASFFLPAPPPAPVPGPGVPPPPVPGHNNGHHPNHPGNPGNPPHPGAPNHPGTPANPPHPGNVTPPNNGNHNGNATPPSNGHQNHIGNNSGNHNDNSGHTPNNNSNNSNNNHPNGYNGNPTPPNNTHTSPTPPSGNNNAPATGNSNGNTNKDRGANPY